MIAVYWKRRKTKLCGIFHFKYLNGQQDVNSMISVNEDWANKKWKNFIVSDRITLMKKNDQITSEHKKRKVVIQEFFKSLMEYYYNSRQFQKIKIKIRRYHSCTQEKNCEIKTIQYYQYISGHAKYFN